MDFVAVEVDGWSYVERLLEVGFELEHQETSHNLGVLLRGLELRGLGGPSLLPSEAVLCPSRRGSPPPQPDSGNQKFGSFQSCLPASGRSLAGRGLQTCFNLQLPGVLFAFSAFVNFDKPPDWLPASQVPASVLPAYRSFVAAAGVGWAQSPCVPCVNKLRESLTWFPPGLGWNYGILFSVLL